MIVSQLQLLAMLAIGRHHSHGYEIRRYTGGSVQNLYKDLNFLCHMEMLEPVENAEHENTLRRNYRLSDGAAAFIAHPMSHFPPDSVLDFNLERFARLLFLLPETTKAFYFDELEQEIALRVDEIKTSIEQLPIEQLNDITYNLSVSKIVELQSKLALVQLTRAPELQ